MGIVIAILIFCVIIIIHELGHFLAAKACGVKVNEFALGMGPIVGFGKYKLKWVKGETTYAIKWLPIGGSVSMEGEDDSSEDSRAFHNKPVWQRMIIIVAGAVMNLILGFIIMLIIISRGDTVATTTIAGFADDAVSSSQLMVGDEIVKVNGMRLFSLTDLSYKLQSSDFRPDKEGNSKPYVFDFVVKRNGQMVEIPSVEFGSIVQGEDSSIKIDFAVTSEGKTFGNVISSAFGNSVSTGRLIWISLMDLVTGVYQIKDLSGPVGVVGAIEESAKLGFDAVLSIAAFISINVGIFNLIPFPALDGGRFAFLVIELVRRKPMKPEHEGMVHFVGILLLFLLMIVVTFQDITKLFLPK